MDFSKARRCFFCFLMILMIPAVSHAGVIYSALPNQSGGSDANGFLEADNFTLAAPAHLGLITFWSFQSVAADYTGLVAWSLRSNASGMPGANIASGTAMPVGTPTGKSAFGLNEFAYIFEINLIVNPGVYWLVLHNGPNSIVPPTDFFWGWSNSNAGNSLSQDLALPDQPWLGNFAELALQVSDIPEPGSLFLAGAGLLALWLRPLRKHS